MTSHNCFQISKLEAQKQKQGPSSSWHALLEFLKLSMAHRDMTVHVFMSAHGSTM